MLDIHRPTMIASVVDDWSLNDRGVTARVYGRVVHLHAHSGLPLKELREALLESDKWRMELRPGGRAFRKRDYVLVRRCRSQEAAHALVEGLRRYVRHTLNRNNI